MPLKALQDSTLTDSREWESFANTALSTLAQKELESSNAKNDIEWKSFKIGELFEINTPKKKFNANAIKFNGKYPYVARGDSNNGIRGYIDEDEAFLNEANTISFGQDTATIFYQTSPYFTGDKIKIFTFKKGELDRYKANFLISVMKKAFMGFSWGSSSFNVENLKNVCVLLPVLPTACHTEPLGEVSNNTESRFFANAQNDKNAQLDFIMNKTTKSNAKAVEIRKQGKAEVSLVNCGFQGESRELPKVVMTADEPKQSPFLAQKPTPSINFNFMESFIKAIEKQHIETLYRFWESKLKAYNAVINGGGGVRFTLSEYEEFCKEQKVQDSQFKPYHSHSFLLETDFFPCHTEPLGEVSKAESNKDISLTKLAQYDKNHNIEWKSFKCEELFSVKSNPQLNKDSFNFSENAPYPYFTRTCLNNGIAGYVEYLDEEHKIKGESIAVGMLGMQFFYMQKDFYAGQFTKTLYPKFSGLNATIAQFFITWLNKNQKIFQGVLVRDFEKTFNETEILLPVLDSNNIDFNFIESFIKALQKECIKSVVLWQEREREAYKKVVK
ncbi:restriction endonuclease subunit S [Helicobacter bilis]|uniref:restriction endonuclease subunit S n=2 Tax=Helicobacter bilis TaxID=37372 RepID=UPI001EE92CDE|nr:restriction endonuclease subunit S [Helicobacter bilis]